MNPTPLPPSVVVGGITLTASSPTVWERNGGDRLWKSEGGYTCILMVGGAAFYASAASIEEVDLILTSKMKSTLEELLRVLGEFS